MCVAVGGMGGLLVSMVVMLGIIVVRLGHFSVVVVLMLMLMLFLLLSLILVAMVSVALRGAARRPRLKR